MFYRRSPKSGCFYWAVTLLRIPPSICCWTLGPACLIRLPLWLPQPLLPVQFTTIRSLVTNMTAAAVQPGPRAPSFCHCMAQHWSLSSCCCLTWCLSTSSFCLCHPARVAHRCLNFSIPPPCVFWGRAIIAHPPERAITLKSSEKAL